MRRPDIEERQGSAPPPYTIAFLDPLGRRLTPPPPPVPRYIAQHVLGTDNIHSPQHQLSTQLTQDVGRVAANLHQNFSEANLHPNYVRALHEFHLTQDPANWGMRAPAASRTAHDVPHYSPFHQHLHQFQHLADHLQVEDMYDPNASADHDVQAPAIPAGDTDERGQLRRAGWKAWIAWLSEGLANSAVMDHHSRVPIGPHLS